ncbi:gamma-aminobutyric acid type b receptor subunit 2-like protein [Plakobranchus ocellatus]|uniref:Gamma-aminobutyric acid type b receptor subunit 2-like protein n=1 Tax=Plakobranchus ocellatus TaxID=259542 RepID=A0AAV3ZJ00_9GAST|nr:gamma-aminobutyric acid type b receptor subunit 2-like protein [Plakobranchus ocellatus]
MKSLPKAFVNRGIFTYGNIYHLAKLIVLLACVTTSNAQQDRSNEADGYNLKDDAVAVDTDDPLLDLWSYSDPYPVGKGIKINEDQREKQNPGDHLFDTLYTESDSVQPYDVREEKVQASEKDFAKGVSESGAYSKEEDSLERQDSLDPSIKEGQILYSTGEKDIVLNSKTRKSKTGENQKEENNNGRAHQSYVVDDNYAEKDFSAHEINSGYQINDEDEIGDKSAPYQRVRLKPVSVDDSENLDPEDGNLSQDSTHLAQSEAGGSDPFQRPTFRQHPLNPGSQLIHPVSFNYNESSSLRQWQSWADDVLIHANSTSTQGGNLSADWWHRGLRDDLSKPIIYIAGLFPWSEDIPAGAVGRGVLPAVHIALAHVNNDTRTERKYILEMAYNDTRVSFMLLLFYID